MSAVATPLSGALTSFGLTQFARVNDGSLDVVGCGAADDAPIARGLWTTLDEDPLLELL